MNTENNRLQNIQTFLAMHTQSHQTYGHEWPQDAECAVVHRTSTWPLGWSDHSIIRFFDDERTMQEYVEAQLKWATEEDNELAIECFQWDLGPVAIALSGRNQWRLPQVPVVLA